MALYTEWKKLAFEQKSEQEAVKFWNEYCEVEKGIYERILEEGTGKLTGSLGELAKEFEVEPITFMGFLDGVNDSLETSLQLEEIEEESNIGLSIDLEKLYYNMLAAKANWLYDLPQWDGILSQERRKEIKKEYNATKTVVKEDKIGRNDPCVCGSGKKYKKCCGMS